jgi:hypothetical protein
MAQKPIDISILLPRYAQNPVLLLRDSVISAQVLKGVAAIGPLILFDLLWQNDSGEVAI